MDRLCLIQYIIHMSEILWIILTATCRLLSRSLTQKSQLTWCPDRRWMRRELMLNSVTINGRTTSGFSRILRNRCCRIQIRFQSLTYRFNPLSDKRSLHFFYCDCSFHKGESSLVQYLCQSIAHKCLIRKPQQKEHLSRRRLYFEHWTCCRLCR